MKFLTIFRDILFKTLTIIAIIIFWIFILGGEFYGIYHSFKKHNLFNNIIVFIPPMAHIMAVESFFHKEEPSNTDINNDCESLASIIVIKSFYSDAITLNEKVDKEIKRLSTKFIEYPDDIRKYLREFGTNLVNFYACIFSNQCLYLKNKYILKSTQDFSKSEQSLIDYYKDCKNIITKYPYSKVLFELLSSANHIKAFELDSEKFFKEIVANSEDTNKINIWEEVMNYKIRAFKIYSELLLDNIFD